MARYSWDEGTQKYISADGQIMGGGTAYKTDNGWSLTQPTTSTGTEQNVKPVQEQATTQNVTTPAQQTTTKGQENVGNTVTKSEQSGALTPLNDEYYQQTSDEALNVIKDNLNRYRQTNPEYFTDYESFKNNFSYNKRNVEQKNVLDTWYKGYQQGLTLANTPTSDLYTQYKSGNLSSAEIENLRVADANKYAALQSQISKGNVIEAYDDDKDQENMFEKLRNTFLQNMLTNLTSAGTAGSEIFEKYRENMESPEMVELSDKTTEIQEKIENIQDDIARMTKEVEAEYEGTGATRSKINAIVADRTYDLQLQLRTLNSEYNKYATQYNNRMQQYQTEFTMELQEYQLNMQERAQKMDELGFAMDLMNYETPLQKEEREWNYWVRQQEYANGNINSKDYDTRYKAALKSVQNLLSQYQGIPMKRSAEQMADDILKAIDEGSNLGAELTKINQQIQQKPEYKYLYNQTYGKTQGFGKTVSIGGVDYVEYNGQLYTANDFNRKFGGAKSQAKYNVVSDDKLNTYDEIIQGTYVGECGKFVNNYLQSIGAGRIFGNETIDERKQWINSDTAKIGTVAIFDYNHLSSDKKNHGHVAIVTSEPDANGNFWVKESNFDGDGVVWTRQVNINDKSLQGFLDPTLNSDGVNSNILTNVGGLNSYVNENGLIQVGSTQFTPTEFDNYVKEYINGDINYSAVDKLGAGALNIVEKRKAELLQNGYQRSTKLTDPKDILSAEKDLMTRYFNMNADSREALKWARDMQTSLDMIGADEHNDTKVLNGASQNIVTAFNKLMDSRSVVRESEYDRTPQGQSLIEQMQGKIKQIQDGGAGLTYDNLKGLVTLAQEYAKGYEQEQNELAQMIKNQADARGLDIKNILPISVINGLQPTLSDEDYWSEYKSSTPSGYVTVNLGNGMSITRP